MCKLAVGRVFFLSRGKEPWARSGPRLAADRVKAGARSAFAITKMQFSRNALRQSPRPANPSSN